MYNHHLSLSIDGVSGTIAVPMCESRRCTEYELFSACVYGGRLQMAEAEGNEEVRYFSSASKNSPLRCPLCLKEKRSFKNEICIDCDSWFLRNVDDFYRDPSKITCPRKPDGGCGKPMCPSCRLSNFMTLTGFSMESCQKSICYFCGKVTICKVTNKVPQCSDCRKLFANRSKKGGAFSQICSCINLSEKCQLCLVKSMIKVIGPRGTLGMKKSKTRLSLLGGQEESDLSDHSISSDSGDPIKDNEDVVHSPVKIVLNGIPLHCQGEAKCQLLNDCKVVLSKILPTELTMRSLNETDQNKKSAEHLSAHRHLTATATATPSSIEFGHEIVSSVQSGKPSFLNQLKGAYLKLIDPLQLSPSSRSITPNSDSISSPIIAYNSGDESVGGNLSPRSSPVLRSSSGNRNRKRRCSNLGVPTPASILPCTPLAKDFDVSMTSVSSNSLIETPTVEQRPQPCSQIVIQEKPCSVQFRTRRTVDVGTQTDNSLVDVLKREIAELRAMIRSYQQSTLCQSDRTTPLEVIIPPTRTTSPTVSLTSTIISLCSPPAKTPSSPIATVASPLPSEFVIPEIEPSSDSRSFPVNETSLLRASHTALFALSTDDEDVEVLVPRDLQRQPRVVLERLTEAELLKHGVRNENRGQLPAFPEKASSGLAKRLRSVFSDSSDSEIEQPKSCSSAVRYHEFSLFDSKKRRLDSQGDGDVRADSSISNGDKKGEESRRSTDKDSKARGGDKIAKEGDKKNKNRKDTGSEKDRKKSHKQEEEQKKEKDKKKETDKQKEKQKERRTSDKGKSSRPLSSKSKDDASTAGTSAPQLSKFKIPRVRPMPNPPTNALPQSESESVLRGDCHPGVKIPSANGPFSTPGTIGLPSMLYERPPTPIQQTTAPKLAAEPSVSVPTVQEAPAVELPVQELEFQEPLLKSSCRTSEGPKSLLRFYVPRTDQRKSVSFSDQLVDDKPQPPSYYGDLPDRNNPESPGTTKASSSRRWFTSERKRNWTESTTQSARRGLFSSIPSPNVSSQEDSSDAESTSSKEDGENKRNDDETENPVCNSTATSGVITSCDTVPASLAKIPLVERSINSPFKNSTQPANSLLPSAKLLENSLRQISPANEFSSPGNAENTMEVDDDVFELADSDELDHCRDESPWKQQNSPSKSRSKSSADNPYHLSCSNGNGEEPVAEQSDKGSTPVPQLSNVVDDVRQKEEDAFEDEDILDLGLDESEAFFCEETVRELNESETLLREGTARMPPNADPTPKERAVTNQVVLATTSEAGHVLGRAPSPSTINLEPAVAAPVKLRILQSQQDPIGNVGLCFHFIGHGNCPYTASQKCHFEHDAEPSKVLNYMKLLCKSNLDLAVNLMTNVIKKESPLHAELAKDWGRSISSTIIWNLLTYNPKDDSLRRKEFMQKKTEYTESALRLLVTPEVRCTTDMCVSVINRLAVIRPVPLSTAVFITRLYQRIDKENIMASSDVWYKILRILTDVADWKKSVECLETALKYFPQFRPSIESLEFLFRDALTKKNELVVICGLFKKMDLGGMVNLHPDLKKDVLLALDNFGLHDLYQTYCQQVFTDLFPNHVVSKIASVPQPGLSQFRAPFPAASHQVKQPRAQVQQPQVSQFRPPITAVQLPTPLPHDFRPPVPNFPPLQPPPPTPELLLHPPQSLLPSSISGPPVPTVRPAEVNNSSNPKPHVARGPNVVVEPSYEAKEQLKRFYLEKNFSMMAQLLINYSFNDINRSMVNDLVLLLKTLPDIPPGKFIARLYMAILEKYGVGNALPQHVVDFYLCLALSILFHLHDANKVEEGYEICVVTLAFNLPIFEYIERNFVPPGVLLFAAKCCIKVKTSDLSLALRFLTVFHIAVKDINVEPELVKLESDISCDIMIAVHEMDYEDGELADQFQEILGLLEDYKSAMEPNSTRFTLVKNVHGWV